MRTWLPLERQADTEDMGVGIGVATGVCTLTDDGLVAGCPRGFIWVVVMSRFPRVYG